MIAPEVVANLRALVAQMPTEEEPAAAPCARKACTECGGACNHDGIECERCDGNGVEPEAPTPGALLVAIAEVLDARELPRVTVHSDRRGPRWLAVDGETVANVKGSVVIVRAVRHGLNHGEDVLPQAQHTPTGKLDEAHVLALDIQVRHVSRAAERARLEASRAPTAYQPQQDTWRRYQVPAREDDRAAGLAFTEVRADELTPEELADLSPEVRAEVDADLAAMDAAAGIGTDDERAWRDHDHGGESQPIAAE